MIKAIFLDYDGTVYSHTSKSIPLSAVKAINELTSKGILVFIATGRCKKEMEVLELADINLSGLVACNGQCVFNSKGELIFSWPCEGLLKEKIVDVFANNKVPGYIVTKDDFYSNYFTDFYYNTQKELGGMVGPVKQYHSEDIYMCAFFAQNEEERKHLEVFKGLGNLTTWYEGIIDINPLGCDKVTGIQKTLEKYGIDISEAMAIGDSDNDASMIEYCGVGVAMGNGKQQVKDVADYVTDSIDDDGLYKAFKHYGLL